jgi:acetyl-CoA acetyltransferase
MTKNIYILGGARTPMAEYTGKLKDFSALELGAIAARAALERTGVKPENVDHVIFGNVLQTSADAVYGARIACAAPAFKPPSAVHSRSCSTKPTSCSPAGWRA